MTINLHDLANMPGYGKAQKELRKAGLWKKTMTDSERIDWIAMNVTKMKRSDEWEQWYFTIKRFDYDPDVLRLDIDEKAMEAKQ